MSRCVDCSSFTFQHPSREMARLRLGTCSHEQPFSYYDPMRERDCPRFQAAPSAVVEPRIKFIQSKGRSGKT